MCYELHHFSTKHIESGTNDALQFQFRRVDKLTQSKVLGSHFVDTQSFHAVDVSGNDCFNQEFRQNVHREHFVVFAGHNHVAFASLDTGIEHILFLIPHQPAEIRTVHAELIETWHNPSQHFVDVVAFGNHGQLTVESTEESVWFHLLALWTNRVAKKASAIRCRHSQSGQ